MLDQSPEIFPGAPSSMRQLWRYCREGSSVDPESGRDLVGTSPSCNCSPRAWRSRFALPAPGARGLRSSYVGILDPRHDQQALVLPEDPRKFGTTNDEQAPFY